MDHEGKVVDFNPAAESIFGYSREKSIGRLMAELIIPERLRQRHAQDLAKYLATGEGPVLGQRIELPALHADDGMALAVGVIFGNPHFCQLDWWPKGVAFFGRVWRFIFPNVI
jgi:hypothetical protein